MDGLTIPLVSEEIIPCDQAKIIGSVSRFVPEQILGPPFLLEVSNGLEDAVLTEMQLIPLAVMSGAMTPEHVELLHISHKTSMTVSISTLLMIFIAALYLCLESKRQHTACESGLLNHSMQQH